MKVEFMSVRQWSDMNPEMKEQETECKQCNGDGYIECETCGHEETCSECEGEGTLNSIFLLYEIQKRKDIILLQNLNLY